MSEGDGDKLARFVVDWLTEQIEEKRHGKHWGEVRLALKFQNGELATAQVGDDVTLKPIDLKRKPA